MRNIITKHINYAIKDYNIIKINILQIARESTTKEIKFICRKHINKYLYPMGRKYQIKI